MSSEKPKINTKNGIKMKIPYPITGTNKLFEAWVGLRILWQVAYFGNTFILCIP